jgi:hypothetical protein
MGPGPPADPTILRRLTYSTQLTLQLLPWLYNLGSDHIEKAALTLLSGLAVTSNGYFLCYLSSRYQATSIPQVYGVHVTLLPP